MQQPTFSDRQKFQRYLLAFVQHISREIDPNFFLDLNSVLDSFFTPKGKFGQVVSFQPHGYSSGFLRSYKVKVENFGSAAFMSVSPITEFQTKFRNGERNDYNIVSYSSDTYYYIKAYFDATGRFVYESQESYIGKSNRTGRQITGRSFLKKVTVNKNGHALLTLHNPKRKRPFNFRTNYFSFKNLSFIKSSVGIPVMQVCFPFGLSNVIGQLIASGLNWNVSFREITSDITLHGFLSLHFKNSGSGFNVTRQMTRYPLLLLNRMAKVKDRYTAAVLTQHLAGLTPDLIAGTSETFCPFLIYYLTKLKNEFHGQSRTYVEDYVKMCGQTGETPNVRLKSAKRLVAEHNRLAKAQALQQLPEFTAPALPSPLLPAEVDGYSIERIENNVMLAQESAEMKHCVASYHQSIKNGDSVVYRITGKERATAEICFSKSDGSAYPYLRQAHGTFNHDCSPGLRELLDRKLREFSGKCPDMPAVPQLDELVF